MAFVADVSPPFRQPGNGLVHQYYSMGLPAQFLDRNWTAFEGINGAWAWFVQLIDAASRLTAAMGVQGIDPKTQPESSPLHVIQRVTSIEVEIDEIARRAFGINIMLDRWASGSYLRFRTGQRPDFDGKNGIATDGFVAAMRELPMLEDQGDGVKSFIGVLLQMFTGRQTMKLIDEPEAFLHPPQARLLGKVLATRVIENDEQIFLATHSSDIMLGVLESQVPLTILRITRAGDFNYVSVVPDESVKRLWEDPVLRYSNLLDGLFHDAVVICESDGDCRFYSAVIDDVLDTRDKSECTSARRPTILYTHACKRKRRPAKASKRGRCGRN